MKKIISKACALIMSFLLPATLFAQEAPEKGIDEKINDWFAPIAGWWESVVLFNVPLTDTISAPFIVLFLAACGLLFTIYFSFVNVRKFPLAIRVTRGKYDYLDKQEPIPQTSANVHTVDGDIVDTIKDESHHGEVNHFQALATAVSGTVGLGNIAGVAVAIALGGARCNLLDDCLRFVRNVYQICRVHISGKIP